MMHFILHFLALKSIIYIGFFRRNLRIKKGGGLLNLPQPERWCLNPVNPDVLRLICYGEFHRLVIYITFAVCGR